MLLYDRGISYTTDKQKADELGYTKYTYRSYYKGKPFNAIVYVQTERQFYKLLDIWNQGSPDYKYHST